MRGLMTPEIREKIRHRIDIGIAHTWDASVLWQHLEAVEKAAAEDTARLDWLQENKARAGFAYQEIWVVCDCAQNTLAKDDTLRAAIDAARKEANGGI